MSRYLVNETDKTLFNGHIPRYDKKLLWENLKPTNSFTGQDITLLSDDYDYLVWVVKIKSSENYNISVVSLKGYGATFNDVSNDFNARRTITYKSNTKFTANNVWRNGSSSDQSYLIPIAIYGGKF